MKRHPALQDLSRDHHVVLVWCQRLRRALERETPWRALGPLVDQFLAFYASDMRPHFEEEDRLVVPLAEKRDAALRRTARALSAEHDGFRAAFAGLQMASQDKAGARTTLLDLTLRLAAHVKEEESELFERLQEAVGEPELQGLWRRSHEYRLAHRAPAACGRGPRATPP